ncbi:hypothetical protein [Paraburkholderia rhizosphaerae]|nr:hypothetical protein [Paraburkholderia rhizosphaerae]
MDIDRGGKHWHLTGNATRNDDEGNVTHLHVSGLTYGFGPSGVAAG